MTVLHFLGSRRAHVDHRQVETQRHARQRVVAVQDDLVVGDVGHGEDGRFFVAALGHAFELHADFDRLRQALAVFDLHQRGIVVAEGVFRLHLDRRRIARLLAVELFLDFRQGVLVATVQVDHRLRTFLDQVVLRVRQFVVHRHDRIFGNLHRTSFRCKLRIIPLNRIPPRSAGYNGA